MNKDELAIIIISFITFIGMNFMIYMVVNEYLKQFETPQIQTEEIAGADTLNYVDDSIPNLVDSEKKVKELKELISRFVDDVHKIENVEYIAHSRLDSIRDDILDKIDKLAEKDEKYSNKIDELILDNESNSSTINNKDETIASLEKEIEELKIKNTEKVANELQKDKENNYTYLAQTYNTMNPAKVAEMLQSLDNETIIQILKRMNQRKTGKVLASMPAYRSALITRAIVK